ncbi:NAD(P)/FAD-dependent oxidoreductase [uncultured Cocleimonas sp.]|uniref:NAD(P)/FAD-dependent oxidoreductase n=1 Tax=uncultured Cocleimonas sp. TaxID=1051587 RepID=UPI0026058479|nr:FAD-dependent oxidoreductase [uncultured Cocleimonas sp.]
MGAGIAGWSVAEALRRRDPERPILLVSACKGYVYPKPAISLALSQGKKAEDLISMDAEAKALELGIDVRTETRIMRVDTNKKRLVTVKGGIEYDKLILAMGAHQKELPITGDAASNILSVNDLQTYKKLCEKLENEIKHITILGAGLIGCEFADDITKAGYKVTVIDPQQQPLSALLPEAMSNELVQKLSNNGVEWKFGATLDSLNNDVDGAYVARLSDDSILKTDLVLSAAGLVANTKLATKMGLKTDNGICVNDDMQTSNPDIYAIGDCASLEGEIFAFIEPIKRQAETISADITGIHEKFMPLPPLVKVKTPSLPLSICRPAGANDIEWSTVSEQTKGGYFELRDGENMIGFALSGDLASGAGSIYKQLSH